MNKITTHTVGHARISVMLELETAEGVYISPLYGSEDDAYKAIADGTVIWNCISPQEEPDPEPPDCDDVPHYCKVCGAGMAIDDSTCSVCEGAGRGRPGWKGRR